MPDYKAAAVEKDRWLVGVLEKGNVLHNRVIDHVTGRSDGLPVTSVEFHSAMPERPEVATCHLDIAG